MKRFTERVIDEHGSLVFDTDNFCSECGTVFHNEEGGDNNG